MTFFEVDTDTNTIVRGFQIRNGYLEGENVTGAGIYLNGCGAKFEEVCITGNHLYSDSEAGGAGVKCEQSNSVFRNSSISYNYIDSANLAAGAAMRVNNGEYLYLDNLQILNNRIVNGGYASALEVTSIGSLNITLRDCIVMHNVSVVSRGAGAMIFVDASVYIYNTVVDSNVRL